MNDTPFPRPLVDKLIKESGVPDIGRASIRELRRCGARVLRNSRALDIGVRNCLAPVGSMHACFSTLMVAGRMDRTRDTVLFIDPGFPVHKQLVKMIGLKSAGFDVYEHRGKKLKAKLESYVKRGNIAAVLYSNPNNPSWICFTEEELKIIGETAKQYGVLVLEDLAYFAMDFRQNLGKPGRPPYQPTVARYTDQAGLAALLKAANEGSLDFIGTVKEYGRRAQIMKDLFLKNGFVLVYDRDGD